MGGAGGWVTIATDFPVSENYDIDIKDWSQLWSS